MNNNDNLEKFISEIESIKMTSFEKNEMRNNLASFAAHYTPTVSPYHHLSLMMRRGIAVAFIAIISIGSLASFASSDALPGDDFYFVKIAHEEIKLATTFDTKKRVSYEIKRTKKRIQEATTLAKEDHLDIETQNTIAQNIQEQANKVTSHIKKIKEKNPEEALILNSELKSTITVNSEALRKATTPPQPSTTEDNEISVNDTTITDSLVASNISTETTDEPITEINIDSTTEEPRGESETIEPTKNADIDNSPEEFHSLTQDTEPTNEIMGISFAETLLDEIQKEVEIIEEFEETISEEIIAEEIQQELIETSTENEIIITNSETIDLNIEEIPSLEQAILDNDEEETFNDTANVITKTTEEIVTKEVLPETILEETPHTTPTENISHSIKSLEDILLIEQRITQLKEETVPTILYENHDENESSFNEGVLRIQADIFIDEQKYKQAFLALQEILAYYQEQRIVKETEIDLGIEMNYIAPSNKEQVEIKKPIAQ